MRWGHLLVLRMANTAADFSGSYCAPDTFPTQVRGAGPTPSNNLLYQPPLLTPSTNTFYRPP